MPTPPLRKQKQDDGSAAGCLTGKNSSLREELITDVDALLKTHHAHLAQQVEQSIEELYVRLCKAHSWADSGPVTYSAIQVCDRPSSIKVQPTYVRSFTESMLIKKNQADQIAKQITERETASVALATAEIDRALSMKRTKSTKRRIPTSLLKAVVRSSVFESFSTFFIVSNALFFGIETECLANGVHLGFFELITIAFTLIFLVELVMRLCAEPIDFFCSQQKIWNAIDTIVVAVSLVELFFQVSSLDSNINLSHIRIIRTARTVRIFRVIRILKAFSSLRILLHCVLNTLRSLIWTIFLLTMVLYVFGILFTQAAVEYLDELHVQGRTQEVNQEMLSRLHLYYTHLPMSIYTLFKAVTGGVTWEEVSGPLGFVHPAWELLFVVFISFTYFAVLNVVTGVFCQSAIESAAHDKDMVVQAQISNKQLYTQQLRDLFSTIDHKNTGSMNFGMLEKCLDDPKCVAYFEALGITSDDAWNLFRLLDGDGSNELDLEEFVEGCLKIRGSARSIDAHLLRAESQWTRGKVTNICNTLNEMLDALSGATPPTGVDFSMISRPTSRRVSSMNEDEAAARHSSSQTRSSCRSATAFAC